MAAATGQVAPIETYRRFFAEEIEACVGLKTPALVEAFATIPRERFLPPGPWVTRSDFLPDMAARPQRTPDADPRRVYHNVVLAIDPSRQLFNGQPGTLGAWIDALGLRPGARVLHIGAGLGYYSAILAHTVGPTGRVLAIEVDEALAAQARANLQPFGWVELRHGDATRPLGESFDAILVNAGATHPHDVWLDALAPAGQLLLPLTVSMPPGGPLGKGLVVLVANDGDGRTLSARVVTMVMIYTGQGIRDESIAARLGQALMRGALPPIKRLTRDPHDQSPSCWLHADGFCLS